MTYDLSKPPGQRVELLLAATIKLLRVGHALKLMDIPSKRVQVLAKIASILPEHGVERSLKNFIYYDKDKVPSWTEFIVQLKKEVKDAHRLGLDTMVKPRDCKIFY